MVSIVIIYPYQKDYWFDWKYWTTTHQDIVHKLIDAYVTGSEDILVERDRDFCFAAQDEKSPPAILLIAKMKFKSLDDFHKIPKESWEQVRADIPNFTNLKPEFMLSIDDLEKANQERSKVE